MASIAINATLHKACSSPHLTNKEPFQPGIRPSFRTKKTTTFVALNVEGQVALNTPEEQNHSKNGVAIGDGAETSSVKFADERWKHGTFVKTGKMDWVRFRKTIKERKTREHLDNCSSLFVSVGFRSISRIHYWDTTEYNFKCVINSTLIS